MSAVPTAPRSWPLSPARRQLLSPGPRPRSVPSSPGAALHALSPGQGLSAASPPPRPGSPAHSRTSAPAEIARQAEGSACPSIASADINTLFRSRADARGGITRKEAWNAVKSSGIPQREAQAIFDKCGSGNEDGCLSITKLQKAFTPLAATADEKAAQEHLTKACEERNESNIRRWLSRAVLLGVRDHELHFARRVLASIEASQGGERLTATGEAQPSEAAGVESQSLNTESIVGCSNGQSSGSGRRNGHADNLQGCLREVELGIGSAKKAESPRQVKFRASAKEAKEDSTATWRTFLKSAKASIYSKPHDDLRSWTFSEWLKSLKLHDAIANAMSEHVDKSWEVPEVQVSFLRKLGKNGNREDVEKMLLDGHILHALADEIWNGARALDSAKATTGLHLNDKFQHEGDTFGLTYGSISTFFAGLEGLVGSPDRQIENAMRREHCASSDSTREFLTTNYAITTTSKAEWYIVKRPEDGPQQVDLRGLGLREWPKEERLPGGDAALCRRPRPLTDFCEELHELNIILDEAQEPALRNDEVCGLRLYTGPMFMKYNMVLRSFSSEVFKIKCHELCLDNKYVTTLHVINSGIVKSGKAMKAATVYRGIQGGLLPENFWKPNMFNVCGGVEFAFMSCTLDRDVAMDYAGGGTVGTIFEIKMGMIDRGADLSWISQYPHEKEICFAPLTGIEVNSTSVENAVLVVNVRLNVNLAALTIEQVLEKRQKVISDMCAGLSEELSRDVAGADWQELADEVQYAKLPIVARDIVVEQLVKIRNRPPADFNDDEVMEATMKSALDWVAKARQQRAEILEEVAERVQGEDADRIRARAAAYLSEEAVVEDVIVSGGPPPGGMTRMKGSALDFVGLAVTTPGIWGCNLVPSSHHRYELLNGLQRETLLAHWKPLSRGWRLLKVNGQKGNLPDKLNSLYVDGEADHNQVVLTFIRPMTEQELKAAMLRITTTAHEEICSRRLERLLDLNVHISALDLRGSGLGDKVGVALATAIETNSAIKVLNLSGNALGKNAGLALARALETNSSINVLHLSENSLGAVAGLAFARVLEKNSSIIKLDLDKNDLGEKAGLAFAKALKLNSTLKMLSVSFNSLGEKAGLAFARALDTNYSLNALHISNNDLGKMAGSAFAKILETNTSINALYLSANALGETNGLALAKALEKNSSINAIYVSRNDLGETACVALAEALELNGSIRTMHLQSTGLGEKTGLAFAKVLETNSFLNVLNLSSNNLGEKAGLALAKALEANASVHELNLASNALGEAAGLALAKALETNISINWLNLSENALGEKAGLAFANTLETNSSINDLNLEKNDLGENVGLALATALEANSSIKKLSLDKNALGETAGLAFLKALETNWSVKELKLSSQAVGETAGLALAKALAERKEC